jgi:hypothetical protein
MSENPEFIDTHVPIARRGQIAAVLAFCGALVGGCGDGAMDKVCQNAGFDEASPEANQNWEKLEDIARDKEGGPNELPITIKGDQIIYGHQRKAYGLEVFERDGTIGKCVKKDEEK